MLEKFYQSLGNSKITLLGYSYSYERKKDEILSKIPFVEVDDKSIFRIEKINLILDNKDFSFLLIDQSNIKNFPIFFKKTNQQIKSKLIITTPIYSYAGGSLSVGKKEYAYLSDLIYIVDSDTIIKNRYN
jgi:hypothetical protein